MMIYLTNAYSTEDNIPFPSLANHIVLSIQNFGKLTLTAGESDNYLICMKHWESFLTSNTRQIQIKAAKVRFSQILEYLMHCITLANERKEGKW